MSTTNLTNLDEALRAIEQWGINLAGVARDMRIQRMPVSDKHSETVGRIANNLRKGYSVLMEIACSTPPQPPTTPEMFQGGSAFAEALLRHHEGSAK